MGCNNTSVKFCFWCGVYMCNEFRKRALEIKEHVEVLEYTGKTSMSGICNKFDKKKDLSVH